MLLTPHIVRTQRDHRRRSAADLHRLAAEPRRRRPAAAHRRDAGARAGAAARRRAGAAGRGAAPAMPGAPARRRWRRRAPRWRRPARRRCPAPSSSPQPAPPTGSRARSAGSRRTTPGASHSRRRRRSASGTAPPPAASDAGAGASARRPLRRRAADHVAGIGAAQVHHLAADHDVPRRRRAVHGADVDLERVAAVDGDADADVRPDEAPRAHGAGGQLHANGRRGRRRSRSRSTGGRIDITLSRAADATGASGTGLLAAVLFDAIAPGSATLTLSGPPPARAARRWGCSSRPVTVTVQQ